MSGKLLSRSGVLLVSLALLAVNFTSGQSPKKGQSETVRSVKGVVFDANGNAVTGAVVQLKNKKSLQIRSFITKERGEYFFTGLSADVDYEVKAESQGMTSPARNVSSFDSEKVAIRDLKLAAK
ncbi:MAG: carboxypeptidase regulatory-like domain-containing protein [Candidatus Solibacter usitatus]|nr:carboxypeptidase regulatory-like domain-containing protein [Candidatus Solibacter usitatus]